MIRCTPVCGPPPVLYWVSGLPLGNCTVKLTVVGFPGVTGPAGSNPASVNTRAAATFGTLTAPLFELLLEPQPASAAAASAAPTARNVRRRLIALPPESPA